MRTILFRGKRLDNGEWVEGYYIRRAYNTHFIVTMQPNEYGKVEYPVTQVDPNTLGQFTGFRDDFGKKVYEGDIAVDVGYPFECGNRKVVYDEEYGAYKFIGGEGYILSQDFEEMRIIGNIHDNL